MKAIQINKGLIAIGFALLMLSACSSSKDFLSDNFVNVRRNHKKIAILPFGVQFQNPVDFSNQKDNRSQKFFTKQEQEASLDAQKELFINVARQVQKGRYEIAFQDFNQTNKILAKNGIRLDDVRLQNKADLAKLLEVDAVIFGELTIKITPMNNRAMPMMPNFRNDDGVETDVKLFDAATGEMVWSTLLFNRPNSQMDTPHRLSTGLMNQVAKNLPYRNR
ncbi:hypothetical protein EMA8858_02924 [Emticicia aquatica]|jgi:hypothetical protein|uniref:DUF4136 domain-containing protein n=1 Tax=Emticicia aquatica TaxID=1681835 RepID=A0ABM9AS73_9BACT|nr:hypothetical protein [Emticicia aquatica]CAH0996789.1 hypothetical protein EMA8858_02924 [Emticicia aquatica]